MSAKKVAQLYKAFLRNRWSVNSSVDDSQVAELRAALLALPFDKIFVGCTKSRFVECLLGKPGVTMSLSINYNNYDVPLGRNAKAKVATIFDIVQTFLQHCLSHRIQSIRVEGGDDINASTLLLLKSRQRWETIEIISVSSDLSAALDVIQTDHLRLEDIDLDQSHAWRLVALLEDVERRPHHLSLHDCQLAKEVVSLISRAARDIDISCCYQREEALLDPTPFLAAISNTRRHLLLSGIDLPRARVVRSYVKASPSLQSICFLDHEDDRHRFISKETLREHKSLCLYVCDWDDRKGPYSYTSMANLNRLAHTQIVDLALLFCNPAMPLLPPYVVSDVADLLLVRWWTDWHRRFLNANKTDWHKRFLEAVKAIETFWKSHRIVTLIINVQTSMRRVVQSRVAGAGACADARDNQAANSIQVASTSSSKVARTATSTGAQLRSVEGTSESPFTTCLACLDPVGAVLPCGHGLCKQHAYDHSIETCPQHSASQHSIVNQEGVRQVVLINVVANQPRVCMFCDGAPVQVVNVPCSHITYCRPCGLRAAKCFQCHQPLKFKKVFPQQVPGVNDKGIFYIFQD